MNDISPEELARQNDLLNGIEDVLDERVPDHIEVIQVLATIFAARLGHSGLPRAEAMFILASTVRGYREAREEHLRVCVGEGAARH